jgi:glucose uptake protein GlcU
MKSRHDEVNTSMQSLRQSSLVVLQQEEWADSQCAGSYYVAGTMVLLVFEFIVTVWCYHRHDGEDCSSQPRQTGLLQLAHLFYKVFVDNLIQILQ